MLNHSLFSTCFRLNLSGGCAIRSVFFFESERMMAGRIEETEAVNNSLVDNRFSSL